MDQTIMADELTKERRSPARARLTIKEATRAFRTALGDTEKPKLIEAPAETTLIQHPKGGFIIRKSGKMTAKTAAHSSERSSPASKAPTRSQNTGSSKSASAAGRSNASEGKSISGRTTAAKSATAAKTAGGKKAASRKASGSTRSKG